MDGFNLSRGQSRPDCGACMCARPGRMLYQELGDVVKDVDDLLRRLLRRAGRVVGRHGGQFIWRVLQKGSLIQYQVD